MWLWIFFLKDLYLLWNEKEEPEAGINFVIEDELDYTPQNLEKEIPMSFLLHCLPVFLIQLCLAALETQDITCSKRELPHLLEFTTFYLASVQSKKLTNTTWIFILQTIVPPTYYMGVVIHCQKYKRRWETLSRAVSANDTSNWTEQKTCKDISKLYTWISLSRRQES